MAKLCLGGGTLMSRQDMSQSVPEGTDTGHPLKGVSGVRSLATKRDEKWKNLLI